MPATDAHVIIQRVDLLATRTKGDLKGQFVHNEITNAKAKAKRLAHRKP